MHAVRSCSILSGSSESHTFLLQVGQSQPSPMAMLRTGFTVPKCPGPPRVTGATKTTVTLVWPAPEDNGGSQVQDYEAEVQPKSKAAMEGGKADDWMLVYQVLSLAIMVYCPATSMLHSLWVSKLSFGHEAS